MLPLDNLIGEENEGWAVAQTLLRHERNTVGNIGYGHLIGQPRTRAEAHVRWRARRAVRSAPRIERSSFDAVATMVVDAYIESVVAPLTSARVMAGLRAGTHQGQWGSVTKLQSTVAAQASVRTALAAWGAAGVIWDGDEVRYDNVGTTWLESRGGTIAGGTNEMQRNIIAERLLGLPREPSRRPRPSLQRGATERSASLSDGRVRHRPSGSCESRSRRSRPRSVIRAYQSPTSA